MILSKFVKLKINSSDGKHYKNLGYVFNYGDIVNIKVEDLTKGSHAIVEIKCDFCDYTNDMMYKEHIINTKKDGLNYCPKCKFKKTKKFNLEKYGVEHLFQSDEIKEKIKKTMLERYDVKNPGQSEILMDGSLEKAKLTRIVNGNQIPDGLLTDFEKYYKKIKSLTRKIKNQLLEEWNGFDYYDNNFILENFNLEAKDTNYPTIDHKISVLFGFLNNISAEKICKLENLCITKRCINSMKNSKTENEFYTHLKNNNIKL